MSVVKFLLKEWVSNGEYNEKLLGSYKMPDIPNVGDTITFDTIRYNVAGKNWDMNKNEILLYLSII